MKRRSFKAGRFRQQDKAAELQVSTFDRTSVFLTSAILIAGFFVATLLAIWITWESRVTRNNPDSNWKTRIIIGDPLDVDETSALSDQDDAIAGDNFAESDQPELAEAIQAVSKLASQVVAQQNLGANLVGGLGDGIGLRGRRPGPESGTPGGQAIRWRVEFEAKDLREYAEQLDFLDLQIGVVEKSTNTIFRVSNLSSDPKVTASHRRAENTTLRFQHLQSRFRRWDRQLVGQTEIVLKDSITCLFYPKSARAQMQQAELEFAQDRQKAPEDIRRTIFKLVADADGWSFDVVDMEFRR